MILNEKKIEEVEKLINDFKSNFKRSLGINVIIKYKVKDNFTLSEIPILNLEELEKIINKFLLKEYNKTLRNPNPDRKWVYLKYKHVFSTLAYNMGYSTVQIGRFLNQTHATIINGRNKCLNLLATKNKDITDVYNEIITYINLIYEYEGDI